MAHVRILRVPQSKKGSGPVLFKVHATDADSLDLSILATESEYVYKATIRDASIQDHRSSKYKGKNDEWAAAVAWVLLGHRPGPDHEDFVQSVESVAEVKQGGYVNLILRQRVSNITQVLGSFSLKEDSGIEIELFEWTDLAIQATGKVDADCSTLHAQLKSKDDESRQLRQQLEDLITAKKEAENVILEKAMHLINSKKLKIRDQQRLIEAAKTDTKVVDRISEASKDSKTSKKTRSSKRKAVQQDEHESSDGSSDDFEKMKVEPSDHQGIHQDIEGEDDDQRTPDPSDDSEDDNMDATSASEARIVSARPKQQKQAASRTQQGEDETMADAPPPRRDLPFGERAKSSPKGEVGGDDEGNETTDDEL